MRTLCLCLLMGMILVARAQEANLQNDPALQKHITVWMALVSLSGVLEAASKQTGVPLRCQDALRDVKVSVFVQDGAAATLLTNLAQLLGYRWRVREEGGYLLYLPDETRQQQEDALKQERAATEQMLRDARRLTRDWLRAPREQRADMFPLPESLNAYLPQATIEDMILESGVPEPSPNPQDALRQSLAFAFGNYALQGEEAGRVLTPFSDLNSAGALLHCLAEAEESVLRMLLEGRTVGFSTRPTPSVYPLASRALLSFSLRSAAVPQQLPLDELIAEDRDANQLTLQRELPNPELGGFWIRLSPWGDQLEFQEVGFTPDHSGGQSGVMLWRRDGMVALPLDAYLSQTEVWRRWNAWATPRREFAEKLRNRRPLERPKPTLNPEMPLLTAHALEWIAWHTGYPILSDASRFVLAPYPQSLDNPRVLLTLLSQHLWLRFDESGYLLARHHRFWTLNQFEIPERLVRPAEAKWLRGEWLTLDDLAPIAEYLSDEQARGFFRERRRSFQQFWLAFDNGFLYSSLPALRFWASLSGTQRRTAQTGTWLPETALTLPQKARFRDALYSGFPPPEQLFLNPPVPYNRPLPFTLDAEGLPRDVDTVLQNAPNQPAFRLAEFRPRRVVTFMRKSPNDEYWREGSFTLQPNEPEPDLSPEAVRKRAGLGENVRVDEVKYRSSVNFMLEFFAPPRQLERYVILHERERIQAEREN